MTYSHAQKTRAIVLEDEILICKFLGPVNRRTACSVTLDEITTLDHEIFDLRMGISLTEEGKKQNKNPNINTDTNQRRVLLFQACLLQRHTTR